MNYINISGGMGNSAPDALISQEFLVKKPIDPRAWHCKTVDEYRLCRYSSDYQGYIGGNDNHMENLTIDIDQRI